MRIADMNWMQVEAYLCKDDRAVLPIGSTEQHGYLSLSVDQILSQRVSEEAAEPLGIPVFPGLPYGLTPNFRAFPGSVSLRLDTYIHVLGDILDGLAEAGFRRILVVNGHGGNTPAQNFVSEWMADHGGISVRFHNWWNAPRTMAKVREIDADASHASWMENFPWTRLAGITMPKEKKPMTDSASFSGHGPRAIRAMIGDGNYGGLYQRSDEDMLAIWRIGVEETRARLDPWPQDD